MTFSTSDLKRFWEAVAVGDECWISRATPSGIYARLTMGGKQILAHVASYIIHHGPVPEGKKVCHKCDTPRCVRPDHIEAKTNSQNMMDMVARGRHKLLLGPKNNFSKLTDEQVIEIRRSAKTTRDLAKEYSVTFQCVWRIRKGIARKYL